MAQRRKKNSGGGIVSSIIAFLVLAGIVQYMMPVLLPIAVGIGIIIVAVILFKLFEGNDEIRRSIQQENEISGEVNSSVNQEIQQAAILTGQDTTRSYADSSAIPEDERCLYYEDEYYTLKTWNDEPVITFEERKQTCIPSVGGLYVAEILLLEYCNKGKYPPSGKSGYPGFWWFQYGLRDVGGALRSLERNSAKIT